MWGWLWRRSIWNEYFVALLRETWTCAISSKLPGKFLDITWNWEIFLLPVLFSLLFTNFWSFYAVDCVWNVMAHAQKPDFVFRRNGRVRFNRRGRQFSRLPAAEVCASAVVLLDTACSEVVWEYWLHTPFASFPFTSPPVRHRVPSGFKRTLQCNTSNRKLG
jgi:hypothetical protein